MNFNILTSLLKMTQILGINKDNLGVLVALLELNMLLFYY